MSLAHESGWCLSAFGGDLVVWENPVDDSMAPGEMRDVSREEILQLFGLLAAGDITSVDDLPWRR
ncbi:hypothetical protein OG963_06365 [Streptomyces sp. NBC_01707]|uniref:hypothetical protein n=1 Tax=Streptomyces sp. NBC_01707 TaxID=2975914 RepID=UPI00352C4EE7